MTYCSTKNRGGKCEEFVSKKKNVEPKLELELEDVRNIFEDMSKVFETISKPFGTKKQNKKPKKKTQDVIGTHFKQFVSDVKFVCGVVKQKWNEME